MIRPAMLLLAAGATGSIKGPHIETAAIVEMIHIATLLHDDVLDNGEIRRNQKTINALKGNKTAILLGDWVLAQAFDMICSLKSNRCQKLMSETAKRICQGELCQTINENQIITEQQYIDIIIDKTACFFSCCCQLGAIINRANDNLLQDLADFGVNFGIAFQIFDDIADITNLPNQSSKTARLNLKQGKFSLPVINYLENGGKIDIDSETLIENITNSGCIDYANTIANKHLQKASKNLSKLPNSDFKTSLASFLKS